MFFDTILNKMVHNLNVFRPKVKYYILSEIYDAIVVAFY